jgi:hypothetical protein
MSRESFDSYRRSFDISARSPIPRFNDSDSMLASSRYSIDSSIQSLHERRKADCPEDCVLEAEEEALFEDVGLSEEDGTTSAVVIQVVAADKVTPVKKKGLFARFGGEGEHNVTGFFSSSKKRQNDADTKNEPEPAPEPESELASADQPQETTKV